MVVVVVFEIGEDSLFAFVRFLAPKYKGVTAVTPLVPQTNLAFTPHPAVTNSSRDAVASYFQKQAKRHLDKCIISFHSSLIRTLCRISSFQLGKISNPGGMNKLSTGGANVHSFVFRDISPVPSLRGKLYCITFSILLQFVSVGPNARFYSVTVFMTSRDG